jgi:hypothetical protein
MNRRVYRLYRLNTYKKIFAFFGNAETACLVVLQGRFCETESQYIVSTVNDFPFLPN